jgi:hypothetical protein
MSGLKIGKIAAVLSFAMFLTCLVPTSIVPAQAANADLSITSADITFSKDNPSSGEMITITAKVHNLGPSAATNVVVSFNVGSAPLLPTKTIATISMSDAKDAAHNYLTSIPGTFVIKVTVTSDQSDPNTADNTAERSLTIGSVVPTVNVTASLSSNIINSKDSFKVNGSANLGSTPVNGGDVTIQIVQNGYTCTTKTNTDGTFESVMAGPTDQGVYTIKVTVTSGAVSGSTQLNLTVLEADLTITKFTPKPTSPKESDTVQITIGVQNIGNGTARNVTFVLKMDNVVVLDKKLGDMTNGQTQNVVYNWKAKKGSHTFDAIIDPSNNITEIKEDNNAFAQQTITVKAKSNKPGPSFEAGVFIIAIVVVLFVMGKGRKGKLQA